MNSQQSNSHVFKNKDKAYQDGIKYLNERPTQGLKEPNEVIYQEPGTTEPAKSCLEGPGEGKHHEDEDAGLHRCGNKLHKDGLCKKCYKNEVSQVVQAVCILCLQLVE